MRFKSENKRRKSGKKESDFRLKIDDKKITFTNNE